MRATPDDQVTDRIATIPNLLSLVRIALIPVFLVLLIQGQDLVAFAVLVVASATDFFDGYLARRLGQVSKLGQKLDPIVDRLSIFAVSLGLALRGILPWWLVAVVFGREAFLLILGVILARHGFYGLPVSMVGKAGTFILLSALPLLILAHIITQWAVWLIPIGIGVAIAGAIVYWLAGIGYAVTAATVIGERRGDTPSASDTLVDQRRPPNGR